MAEPRTLHLVKVEDAAWRPLTEVEAWLYEAVLALVKRVDDLERNQGPGEDMRP